MSFSQRISEAFQTLTGKSRGRALVYTTGAGKDEMFDDEFMHWFLVDEKVNRCITINAGFATITSGFTTEIEVLASPPAGATKEENLQFENNIKAKYKPLLDFVNAVNAKCNMDTTLFYTLIRALVHGKMAWLKIPNKDSVQFEPRKLVQMPIKVGTDSGLQPKLDEKRDIEHFVLPDEKDKNGKPKQYTADEILYFCYMDLSGTCQGLSSLYPVLQACKLRSEIRSIHYSKSLTRMWKMPLIASVDTEGFPDTDEGRAKENELMQKVTAAVDSGQNFAINKSIDIKNIQLTVNLVDVLNLEKSKGEEIIANFGTAPFLVNQLSANFATAHVEYDSFISGTVADLQRFLKRELEAGWYRQLVKSYYTKGDRKGEDSAEYKAAVLEVRVKHVWRPAKKMSNVKEMVEIASILYERGMGLCGEHPELAAEIAGLAELEAKLSNANNNSQSAV
jgi:hypothetical protein